jgi:glycerophosphoryl diester phosphodiesterase
VSDALLLTLGEGGVRPGNDDVGGDVLPIRPPVIVHHMAALDGTSQPNSLEAVRACLAAGAQVIEVDVTALADSDYLLVHDSVLESETTGHGPVGACTAAEARRLFFTRAGVPTPFRVPLLSEVVDALLDHGGATRIQLDLKNIVPFPTDEPLRRLVELIRPIGERVSVSTNADWQLRRLRLLAPWLELGLDIHFYLDWRAPDQPVDPRAYPRRRGAYGYWDDHPLASQRFWTAADYLSDRCGMLVGLVPGVSTFYVSHALLARSLDDGFNWAEALHEAGIQLDAWTLDADDPAAMVNARRLLGAGVDQFTTNTPRELRVLLASL